MDEACIYVFTTHIRHLAEHVTADSTIEDRSLYVDGKNLYPYAELQ